MTPANGIRPEHWQAHHPTFAQVEGHGQEGLWIYRYGMLSLAPWSTDLRVVSVYVGRALGGGGRIVAHAGPPIEVPGGPCADGCMWCAVRFDDRGIPHSYGYDRETGAPT